MEKLLTVVFVSSLLLVATLGDDASSGSSVRSLSLDAQRGHALGRKGREERGLRGYHHYRREGELKEQHEVASMEVKNTAERKDGETDDENKDADGTEGLISSADYSGVAMHTHSSPPVHKKHPKP